MSKPWLITGRVAYLYTDSFLVISGLLAAYTLSKFSPVKSIISRYIRLVYMLFLFLFFHTTLINGKSAIEILQEIVCKK